MSSSVLAMLRKLMAREAPAQTEPVREALRRSARTGREHAVVGASDKPVGGSVVEGDKYTVMPSSADRSAALMSDRPVLDVHTHPVGALGVRPSPEDFAYYRDKYGAQVRSGPVARELRSLIVQPPERAARASAAYNFFATDKPLAVFDPRRIDDARYELQRGAARGKFRSIMDDPAFRDYFEYGGDIGDLMEDAASLMLLRRRAEQGLGRHELQLGNRLITPDTRATERRLFEMMTPEALELLRAKKMATGGAVKSGDEMSEEEYLARLQQLRPRSGRRAEELNQSRGVNMPLQLARGWAAGTAGLPGDVESLLRMVPLPTRGGLSRAAEKTVLPTSEEILPRIPGEDTSPAGQLFSGMGTLAGGAGVTKIARGVNRAADVAGNRMVQAITGNPQATAVGVLQEAGQMSPLAAIVKPQGNINLRPVLSAEALRGPDVQPVEAFLAQAKGTPGVTQDAFKEIAARYEDIAPGTKLSKADFEARIPPSEYSKVDLHTGQVGSQMNDDIMEQARDMVVQDGSMLFDNVLDRLGVRARGNIDELHTALQDYHAGYIGFDELPSNLRSALRRAGMDDADDGFHLFDNLVQEELDNAVMRTAEDIAQYANDDVLGTTSGYAFQDTQRLLPNDVRAYLDEGNYFELGVSHPQRAGTYYRHYSGYDPADDGLIGHIRGTRIPKDFSDPMVLAPGVRTGERQMLKVKPNSVIIEEIQSDAQKGALSAEQTGALRQVHGTLFKAAVDDALEKGATTVYYPTARTIAMVRGNDPAPYASIYDQQIMREGLKPLGRIPGVEIKPIQLMGASPGGKAPAPYTAYYEINFSPEAKEHILNGPGQTTPGYGKGGFVNFNSDEIAQMAGKFTDQFTPGYAAGGLVKYDPAEIDTIVSEMKEAFHG